MYSKARASKIQANNFSAVSAMVVEFLFIIGVLFEDKCAVLLEGKEPVYFVVAEFNQFTQLMYRINRM